MTELDKLKAIYEHSCSVDVKLFREADIAERDNFFNPSRRAAKYAKAAKQIADWHYEEQTNPARAAWQEELRKGRKYLTAQK